MDATVSRRGDSNEYDIEVRPPMPDTSETREKIRQLLQEAAEAKGLTLLHSRMCGSVFRSENPLGVVWGYGYAEDRRR